MSTRRKRLLLRICTIVMGSGAAIGLAWPALSPVKSKDFPLPMQADTGNGNSSLLNSASVAWDWQRATHISLRRVLHDPPPAPPLPLPEAKPLPPLNFRLTGTIYDPGHCQAIIEMPDGQVELKAIGEMASNARIIDIQEGQATVEYFGKTIVLKVAKEDGSG